MGAFCTKYPPYADDSGDENERQWDAQLKRKIDQDTQREKSVNKILLLGAGESGKSTIFKQVKVLFQTGFSEAERASFARVIHANVYQSIKTLFLGSKEFAESDEESLSRFELQPENKAFAEMISEIESTGGFPELTKDMALKIQSCWRDPAIQAAYNRGNELQLPDCTHFFLEKVLGLAEPNYTPSQEDVLYARQQTTGIVEIEFRPVGDIKRKGELYRLFDVGGQRNERKKWIHLFDGVTAVIFCASLNEYDQTLFEENTKNRMVETKELFDSILKEPWFKETSFLLFLNKFDLFEKKASKVPLTVCEWFQDYTPAPSSSQEIDHAYDYIKQKFQELYNENTPANNLSRIFKIYKTTALDKNLMEKTFQLVDQTLTLKRLKEMGML